MLCYSHPSFIDFISLPIFLLSCILSSLSARSVFPPPLFPNLMFDRLTHVVSERSHYAVLSVYYARMNLPPFFFWLAWLSEFLTFSGHPSAFSSKVHCSPFSSDSQSPFILLTYSCFPTVAPVISLCTYFLSLCSFLHSSFISACRSSRYCILATGKESVAHGRVFVSFRRAGVAKGRRALVIWLLYIYWIPGSVYMNTLSCIGCYCSS